MHVPTPLWYGPQACHRLPSGTAPTFLNQSSLPPALDLRLLCFLPPTPSPSPRPNPLSLCDLEPRMSPHPPASQEMTRVQGSTAEPNALLLLLSRVGSALLPRRAQLFHGTKGKLRLLLPHVNQRCSRPFHLLNRTSSTLLASLPTPT